MSSNVYANGREVSAKKDSNKSIAAMPDVCLSPPSPPAGPIPIPYPNFSKASDTSAGTKKVLIKGKEVGKKNSSNYKSSKGDIAATRSFGMGVVTHTLEKKTYHAAWSFNVKFEGENAIRHMDITTHNHGSTPPNTMATTVDAGLMKPPHPDPDCEKLDQANRDARADLASKTKDKSLVGPGGKGKGTTVSSSQFQPAGGGGATIRSAHSRNKAHEMRPKRFKKGGKMADRKAGKSGLCPAAKHKHASPASQKSGHAEARLMDGLFKGKSKAGKLTFSIDWKPKAKGAKPSRMPCPDCHKMLCAAQACGVEIYLCSASQQVPVKEHCPATPASYQSLKTAMGE